LEVAVSLREPRSSAVAFVAWDAGKFRREDLGLAAAEFRDSLALSLVAWDAGRSGEPERMIVREVT
jgi:hypothetical protein